MSIEVMKQALEALCLTNNEIVPDDIEKQREAAIEALRQAIEQAEQQEPVAWLDAEFSQAYAVDELSDPSGTGFLPLYTAPPKREWVGLTDEEVSYFRYQATFCDELDTAFMAELIEKDLKEKNT
jgi:hypothetical protein